MDALEVDLIKRRTVKLVVQNEVAECGLAALAMISTYHGLKVDLSTLRSLFRFSTRGMPLKSLLAAADRLRFIARAVRADLHEMKALTLPAILHWDLNHFVVLERIKNSRFLIHDPRGQSRWVERSELSDHYTGVAVEIAPSIIFEPKDVRNNLSLRNLWSSLPGAGTAVSQVAILSILLQIFIIASPIYMQVSVDRIIPEENFSLIVFCTIGYIIWSILNGFVLFLRGAVFLSAGASLGYGLSTNIAKKLFQLPIDWFERRHVGDIVSRFQSTTPIRKLMAEDAPIALIDGIMALFTFFMMLYYSTILSVISIGSLIVVIGIRIFFYNGLRSSQEEVIVSASSEQSTMMESIRGIRTLRMSGLHEKRLSLWQSKFVNMINSGSRYQRTVNLQSAIQQAILSIENIFIVSVGAMFVINKDISIGMLFAYFAYKSQFLITSSSLIDKIISIKMLSVHLGRISDIAFEKDDVAFSRHSSVEHVFKSTLELRNISYRYSDVDQYILKDLGLIVDEGESVAITGPSGGGKTTLLKIILGLAVPDHGEIMIGGKPIELIGYRNYHQHVACVLQDDVLFAGSIADNISLFDDNPDRDLIRKSAIAAAIMEDIDRLPMGLDTLVGDMGAALSGGQKQRVLIARAIYRRPKILVVDEGTSHLDEERESAVNAAISALGITRVIVAHRVSTIQSADRAFILRDGKLEPLPKEK